MTATYIYLGYGVTDNQGKAKLEYDSEGNPLTHSYTGTGAGEVDIVASLDNTITESSLVSETYELIDAIVIENELTANKTWNIELNDTDFYLEFTVRPTTSNNSIGRIQIGTSSSYIAIGDLYTNANCGIQWSGGSFIGKAISPNEDTKITVRRTGTNVSLTVGETSYSVSDMSITCTNLIGATITNNSIKDFLIYPI